MNLSIDDLLFIGTYGHVLAVRKSDGALVWDVSLPRTGYSVVSIVYEDGTLFCASGGRVFALDPTSGETLWTNGLKGMGKGLVYLTTAQSNNAEAVMALLAQQRAADAQASQHSGGAGQ